MPDEELRAELIRFQRLSSQFADNPSVEQIAELGASMSAIASGLRQAAAAGGCEQELAAILARAIIYSNPGAYGS